LDATPEPSLPFFETMMASFSCCGILLKKLPTGDLGRGETAGNVGVRRVKEGVRSALFSIVELLEREVLDSRMAFSYSFSYLPPISASESSILLMTEDLSSEGEGLGIVS